MICWLGWKIDAMRLYTFKVHLVPPGTYHTSHIEAETDLEAMTKWCGLVSVNDLDQDDIVQLVITSKAPPYRRPNGTL
jgi:hypothetical protein